MRSGIVGNAVIAIQFVAVVSATSAIAHPALATPLNAPSGLKADGRSVSTILLTWKDKSVGETGFEIEMTTGGGAPWRTVATAPANANRFIVSGLKRATMYASRVRAVRGQERSKYSNSSWAGTWHVGGDESPDPSTVPSLLAPSGLSAVGTSPTTIDLSWTDNARGEQGYTVEVTTDGTKWIAAGTLPADATRHTLSGLLSNTAYASRVRAFAGNQQSGNSNHAWAKTLTPAPAPTPALPAPAGLTANGRWIDRASVVLAWQPVSGAASYNVYRDGQRTASGVSTTGYVDSAVVSGVGYSYSVSAVGADGREGARSAVAAALAPLPPSNPGAPVPAGGLAVPTNLRVRGVWIDGFPGDVLVWDAVPGAKTYNVYRYDDQIASGLTSPTLTVGGSRYRPGMTYTVTAVGEDGTETFPSALAAAQGSPDPSRAPSWIPPLPRTPMNVVAAPEWNAGKPRVVVSWRGGMNSTTYNIYRDGVKVADGVWGLYYIDTQLTPGEVHTYAVSACNRAGVETRESVRSLSVTGTAPAAAPAAGGVVTVTGIRSNDDSAMVYFEPVPGAKDYRAYRPSNPSVVKYSGGNTSVEWNGIDPARGETLIVEAVDKLGPYQKMDGDLGPGAMDHKGGMRMEVNGQGDPSNVPNVLARSAPFTATCQPRTMAGEQVFFDTFRDVGAFVPASVPPALWANNRNRAGAVQNDKWLIYNVSGDLASSRVFAMSGHFMDTLYDGGTVGTNDPLHQDNAALIMQPKQYADISGGKVLHATFEVDAHFGGRRWCDVIVAAADDQLANPGKFAENNLMPTVSGDIFRWEIRNNVHTAQRFQGMGATGRLNVTPLFDQKSGVGPDNFGLPARITWDGKPQWNGTTQNLDRRHRFDLYLSRDRFQVWEDGVLIKDKQLPAGTELPYTKVAVYFLHLAYHTSLDRRELLEHSPQETYWINHRPFADERHWDNMGFAVVPGFPTALRH